MYCDYSHSTVAPSSRLPPHTLARNTYESSRELCCKQVGESYADILRLLQTVSGAMNMPIFTVWPCAVGGSKFIHGPLRNTTAKSCQQ